MKRVLFVALALGAMAGGARAFQNSAKTTKKAATVYTYYLDIDCDKAIECSPDFDGNVCEQEFAGSIVYDQPGCDGAHQTSNIIGKKQP